MRLMSNLHPLSRALLMCVSFLSMTVYAGSLGGIYGHLMGPNGRPLPGAKVIVTGPALMGQETLLTDTQGFYRTNQLPPGNDYRVRFEAKDMHPYGLVVTAVYAGRITHVETLCLASARTSTRPFYPPDDSAPNIDFNLTMPARKCAPKSVQQVPLHRDWLRW